MLSLDGSILFVSTNTYMYLGTTYLLRLVLRGVTKPVTVLVTLFMYRTVLLKTQQKGGPLFRLYSGDQLVLFSGISVQGHRVSFTYPKEHCFRNTV